MDALKLFFENCVGCYRRDVLIEIKTVLGGDKGVFFCFLNNFKTCAINEHVNGCLLDKETIELYEQNRFGGRDGD